MKRVTAIDDIHTHNPLADNAIINLNRGGLPSRPGAVYSVGWHPWWDGTPDWPWIESTARLPQVVQIGECGIDRRKGAAPVEEQLVLTERHARLAEDTGKPLLLHIVGAWSEIIALRKRLRPAQRWIIHGFRGNATLARQLLDAGFDISLGLRYNPAAAAVIPPDRLHRETD